ncbi:hypothetical protein J5X98_17465 [Leptothermofonsia sichuanensis E412]|uniref:hypothetical protein n=1 Tax=Leptothermofonsia sichuanensis TaxID=2917832 RepID=UPI001CA6B395|nr:hypothetical protein [Leptothermofonsia sichuanensis]QZZ19182.1 hypothetical protein J5X98_17465 [Leptothermofonsia sichuanensis E412]
MEQRNHNQSNLTETGISAWRRLYSTEQGTGNREQGQKNSITGVCDRERVLTLMAIAIKNFYLIMGVWYSISLKK